MWQALNSFGCALALVLYTLLVASRARRSVQCTCRELNFEALAPTNNCTDEVKWLLKQLDSAQNTIRPVVLPTSNKTTDRKPPFSRRPFTKKRPHKDFRFYGKLEHEDEEPVDRELYVSLFADDKPGIFVDVGRQFNFSLSRFFEESLAWEGILVGNGGIGNRRVEVVREKLCEGGDCTTLAKVLRDRGMRAVDLLIVEEEENLLKGMNFKDALVRVAILRKPNKSTREVLVKGGLCFARAVGRYELWIGDAELRSKHCGWEKVLTPP